MEHKEIFEVEITDGIKEFIFLVNSDGWQTMLKSEYDAIQAAQSTPMVTDDSKS